MDDFPETMAKYWDTDIPVSYPFDRNGPLPLDADASLDWLNTAKPLELKWYYDLLLGPRI